MPVAITRHRSSANLPTYQPDCCTLDHAPHSIMAGIYHNERLPGMNVHSSLLLNDHYGDCLKLKSFDHDTLNTVKDPPSKNIWKRSRESCKYVSFDPVPNIIPSIKVKGSKHSNSDAGVYHKHKASRQ